MRIALLSTLETKITTGDKVLYFELIERHFSTANLSQEVVCHLPRGKNINFSGWRSSAEQEQETKIEG